MAPGVQSGDSGRAWSGNIFYKCHSAVCEWTYHTIHHIIRHRLIMWLRLWVRVHDWESVCQQTTCSTHNFVRILSISVLKCFKPVLGTGLKDSEIGSLIIYFIFARVSSEEAIKTAPLCHHNSLHQASPFGLTKQVCPPGILLRIGIKHSLMSYFINNFEIFRFSTPPN